LELIAIDAIGQNVTILHWICLPLLKLGMKIIIERIMVAARDMQEAKLVYGDFVPEKFGC
jgi:hypothetical protein